MPQLKMWKTDLILESGQKALKRRRKYTDIDTRIDKLGLAYITTKRTLDTPTSVSLVI